MINLKLGISGHRPHKITPAAYLQIKRDLRERLEILAEDYQLTLLSGMALGVDLFAAKVAAQIKLPFEAFIPFDGYDSRWSPEDRADLQKLLAKARKIHIVCSEASKFAFIKRNEALVTASDQLLAYLLPQEVNSGTAQTVNFAYGLCKPVKVINPLDLA